MLGNLLAPVLLLLRLGLSYTVAGVLLCISLPVRDEPLYTAAAVVRDAAVYCAQHHLSPSNTCLCRASPSCPGCGPCGRVTRNASVCSWRVALLLS